MPFPGPGQARRCARIAVLIVGVLALIAGRQTVSEAQIIPVPLVPGWNNVAYLGPAQPVQSGLAAIAGQFDALWRFDAATQQWRSYNPAAPASSDFSDLIQGQAYWIHMLAPAVLPIGQAGGGAIGSRQLLAGWNNIVQAGASTPVRDALSPYGATYTVVWHWNAALQRWELFDPNAAEVSDFQSLIQGQAYFVQVTAATPGAGGSAALTCYPFESYQPQLAEVADTLYREGSNALVEDPSFRLPDERFGLDGGAATMSAYIPPTLLKAIAYIESGWRQATYSVSRGNRGRTITSSQCAYGLSQVLSGMQVNGTPTPRQNLIGSDYRYNAAAGGQILVDKWNMAPQKLPIYGRHDPRIIEDWYFALWAYHCFGDVCSRYNVHDNPDDPSLKWPRPMYGSAEYKSGPFTASDYPYQELIFGRMANPPVENGLPLWQAVPVLLPPHGTVGFPNPNNTIEASAHLEGGQALAVPTPIPTASPTPSPSATPAPITTPTPRPSSSLYYPPVGG